MNILGMGWLNNEEYGGLRKIEQKSYDGLSSAYSLLQEDGILSGSIKNFGRFCDISKKTCISVALALFDANLKYSKENMLDSSLVGLTSSGSLDSNIRYYKDYIESGRKLARGNYFAYTLSTSSLSEASIAFGLNGAVYSVMPASLNLLQSILEEEAMSIASKKVIVVQSDDKGMLATVLSIQNEKNYDNISDIDLWFDLTQRANNVNEMITCLTTRK